MKILYVEDDSLEADHFRFPLEHSDWFADIQLVHAKDYREAVSALASGEHFDAVISDYRYSGIADGEKNNSRGNGGLDLLEHVTKVQPTLPFIYYSKSTQEEITNEMSERRLSLPEDRLFKKPNGHGSGVYSDVVLRAVKERFSPASENVLVLSLEEVKKELVKTLNEGKEAGDGASVGITRREGKDCLLVSYYGDTPPTFEDGSYRGHPVIVRQAKAGVFL